MATKNAAGVTLIEPNEETYSVALNTALNETADLIRGYADVDIAGTGSYTLGVTDADPEARVEAIRLTGTLTGNRTVNIPTTTARRSFIVYNNTTGAFSVTVQPSGGSGVVIPQGSVQFIWHNGTQAIPLGNASVPGTSTTWTTVSGGIGFSASWVDFGGSFLAAAYRKVGDYVEVRGAIKNGTATSGTVMFTLPTGFRPPNILRFIVASQNPTDTFGIVDVNSSGQVIIIAGGNTFLSLAGIRFSVLS